MIFSGVASGMSIDNLNFYYDYSITQILSFVNLYIIYALQPPVVNYTLVFCNTPLGIASGYPIGFSREIKQVLTHSRQGPLRIASASWG